MMKWKVTLTVVALGTFLSTPGLAQNPQLSDHCTEPWKNHGHYVSCVARTVPDDDSEHPSVADAARSDVGKPGNAVDGEEPQA